MRNRSTPMAVIGVGPVGFAVAKALLQHGIPYEQLEADGDLGGNWYHGIYESAHIISSKKTAEYADFPMPEHYPGFPSAQQMRDYLRAYVETHPTFNSELLHYAKHGRIRPRPDVERFEGNRVFFVDGTADEFEMVGCATGFHLSFPFLPPGPGPLRGRHALLYGGCMLPDYKNLYVVGTAPARYGFGPLMTPAADLIGRMIKLQDQMELPIGLVLRASGARPPHTHLLDPHRAVRKMGRAKYTLPLLLWKKWQLRKRLKPTTPPVLRQDWRVSPDADMQVFRCVP